MIASLLCGCGLDLGPQDDMLRPAPNNPEGFWESRSFLRLNDALLKAHGGTWDCPPRLDAVDWTNEPSLHPLRVRARKLLDRFAGCEPWGWKDPRNSLTLPFWRTLLPEMKVLICVRDPLAVAESLWVRSGISRAAALRLWFDYNRAVWNSAPASSRLVTLCDNYLDEPRTELRRALEWCGLAATEETIERVCRRVKPALVHHRTSPNDLERAGASDELLALYAELREEALLLPCAA